MTRFGFSCLMLFGLSHVCAHAQEIDCHRLRISNIPYEIKMDMNIQFAPGPSGKRVTQVETKQVYRSDKGGPKTIYSRQGKGAVVKITAYGLLRVEMARLQGPVARYEYPNFDVSKMQPGSDYTFEQISTSRNKLGNEMTEASLVSLKVVKESVVTLSNCPFAVVEYHVENVDPQSKKFIASSDIQYMPELQEVYSSIGHNVVTGVSSTSTAKDIHVQFVPLQLD